MNADRVPSREEEGSVRLMLWEDAQIKEHGFFIHLVPLTPQYMNAHTHGVEQTWKHRDFQIVLGLGQSAVTAIFWNLVNRVKDGETFESGKDYDKIIGGGYKVRMLESIEAGRKVLRVMLPDADCLFPGDKGCSEHFAKQAEVNVSELETKWACGDAPGGCALGDS